MNVLSGDRPENWIDPGVSPLCPIWVHVSRLLLELRVASEEMIVLVACLQ